MLYIKPAEFLQETDDESSNNTFYTTYFTSPCRATFPRVGCIQSQSILEDQIINLRI